MQERRVYCLLSLQIVAILCGINNIPKDSNKDVVKKFKTLVEDILKLNSG